MHIPSCPLAHMSSHTLFTFYRLLKYLISHIHTFTKKSTLLSCTHPIIVHLYKLSPRTASGCRGRPLRYTGTRGDFLPVFLGLLGCIETRLVHRRVVPALVVLAIVHQCPDLLVQLPADGKHRQPFVLLPVPVFHQYASDRLKFCAK